MIHTSIRGLLIVLSFSLLSLANLAYADERLAQPLTSLAKSFIAKAENDAEIIQRITHITIDENFYSTSHAYVAIYINSDEAIRDYSQISVSFNSFYEDIALEFANVRTPDGDIHSIQADATQIQSPADENFYHDQKELLFSLPNVRKGAIIEFQYRYTDSQKIIPKQWFDSFSFHWWEGRAAGQGQRADPVNYSELQVIAPASMRFFYNETSNYGITKKHNTKANQQTLTWQARHLPAVILQEAMPREHSLSAHLRISTMQSWQSVATWADQLIAPHITGDASLDTLIQEIKQTATSPETQVKAVYEQLQEKVRYVFAHVGRGGYEPHSAFEVLSNGYGDCKDQSVLAVTLLRKLGIEAYPALITTRSRGLPIMTVPAVTFDHMIVYIPAQPGIAETWMDTTGETSLYPGHSLGLEGQPALIVNNSTKDIRFLPTEDATKNYANLTLIFDKFSGKDVQAKFTFQLGGIYEQHMRSMWQYSREKEKYFRELVGHVYSAADVTDLKANNADNLWQAFSLEGHYNFADVRGGAQTPVNYGFNITQLIGIFTNLNNLHKPADRKQNYVTDPGYILRARIIFASPSPQHQPKVAAQGQNIDNDYFTLQQSGREEEGKYVVDVSLTMKPNNINPKNYADYYQQIRTLLNTPSWAVSFEYDKSAAELIALKQKVEDDKGAAGLIAIAKHHMKNGAFDKALTAAQGAVKAEPKNGEGYYVLGLAQGYENLLDESDESFLKAEKLGYSL